MNLWKVEDVMNYLQCSKAQVWKLCRSRGLPRIRIGCKFTRFKQEDVEKWTEEHKDFVVQ